ncbi:MAG TPA: hypothetical protein VMV46_04675 [Thermoanaerobaculia bacterium]|nr:hypothetical protein [Thermoanaerobaculia bacterium]
MSETRPTEEELDALYAGPLSDFVARRRELAKALEAEGRDEAAARVGALVKPVVSAWAVNRLALAHRADFDRLLAAGDAVREAQRGGDAAALRSATEERKREVARALGLARDELAAAGSPASAAIGRRIQSTLEALAAWGAAQQPDPPPGRLDGDIELPGFEALLGMLPAASGPRRMAPARGGAAAPRGRSKPAPKAASRAASKPGPEAAEASAGERRAARRAVDEARAALQEAVASREKAGREEGGLRRQAERIGRTVRLAEERLAREREKLGEVEGELARVRTAIERARFAEATARAALKRAEEALAALK